MVCDYDFHEIETKWQKIWETERVYEAENGSTRPKYYVLDMFPYPSGSGLHIGHPEGYTASDILARYHWARGFNVLHPMGWDAFGLPAEQHAIQTGTPPAINTEKNVQVFREQIKRLGFAIDWSREINTTDPCYYRWTQWIFLQLFRSGLAYVDKRPVWWCPALKTVLANEEIVNGRSERGNHPVERKPLRQWVLRITQYAEKLLANLENLDWPESTKRQQTAWIGRSEGWEVRFAVEGHPDVQVSIYTTRLDTIYGVTFLAVAPENPLLDRITQSEYESTLKNYRQQVANKSDLDRTDLAKNKTGVFTGAYAIHPLTKQRIPIWAADYVLMSYGTGAIMAVPAHDQRDLEFAQTLNLDIREVIENPIQTDDSLCESDGILINSLHWNGLTSREARQKIGEVLSTEGVGRPTVQYKLRDWLFSRQRYWGEPIPIFWVREKDYSRFRNASIFSQFLSAEPVFYEENGEKFFAVPLTERHLPLVLPQVHSYQPSDEGESPLANASTWVNIEVQPETGEIESSPFPFFQSTEASRPGWVLARRETNTMPQWAGSCWYHLRYLSPEEDQAPVNFEAEKYWGGPDFYIGGAEHAVLHLLYARFWHEFLHSIGIVSHLEPYPRLFHQGIILGEDGNKMSKSRGNVINPDVIIDQYGADSLRLYEMFLGPLEAMKPWSTKGIEGVFRFLKKVWRWILQEDGSPHFTLTSTATETAETKQLVQQTIQKVSDDIEALRFNTAISQLMILLGHLQKQPQINGLTAKIFLQLLAPFAPHICEELWHRMGETGFINRLPFPEVDTSLLHRETVKMVLQVNGRVRGEMEISSDADKNSVLNAAKLHPQIEPYLAEREIVKEIYVAHKIVNFVVR